VSRAVYVLVCLSLLCLAPAALALTEREQQGVDKLLSDTLSAMTGGKPALYELFSTQGSAAVIRSQDGFVAANRARLKSQNELAGAFVFPQGTKLEKQQLQRCGEFIMGRAVFMIQIEAMPAPQVAAAPTPVAADLGGVWDSFWWNESRFRVQRAAPQPRPRPVKIEQRWEATVAAVQDGPQRSWRYVSLAVTPLEEAPDQAAIGSVQSTLRTWERCFVQGDTSELASSLYNDPFVVAAYTPDGQAWFFTYPEYLTTMLGSALAMGSADRSSMGDMSISVSGSVASVVGRWSVDIPMFGSMEMGLTGTLVKDGGKWMVVSLCGGMME